MPPVLGMFGPPGWGGRGDVVGDAFGADADAFPPVVTLVWTEVWVLLFTVVPLWDARALSRSAPPLVRESAKLPPDLPLGAG